MSQRSVLSSGWAKEARRKKAHLLEANGIVAAGLPFELGNRVDDLLAQLGLLARVGLIHLLGEVGGSLGRQAEGLVEVAVEGRSGGSCSVKKRRSALRRERGREPKSKLTLLTVRVDLVLLPSSTHIESIIPPISTKSIILESTHIDIPISVLSKLASEVERSNTATVTSMHTSMPTRLDAHITLTPRLISILLPPALPALLNRHALLIEIENLSLLIEDTELKLLVEEAVDLRVDATVDTVVEIAECAVVVVPGHRVVGEGDVGFVGDVGLAGFLGGGGGSSLHVGKVPVITKRED
jgi:hypothetical protein